MTILHIYLLGAPRFELCDKPLSLGRRKSEAILAYLAVTNKPQQRESLATLFWPEVTPSQAFSNLRRNLSVLRTIPGMNLMRTAQNLVWLDFQQIWLDVAEFKSGLSSIGLVDEINCDKLAATIALYAGPFMAGFTLPDCPVFDDWQYFQRSTLAQDHASGLRQLVKSAIERGNAEEGIEFARALLAEDPLDEATHRDLMRLFAWRGQWSVALQQYEQCADLLQRELGVPPSEETIDLLDKIATRTLNETLDGWHGDAAHLPATRYRKRKRQYALPSQVASLVGRTREMAELAQLLEDPDIRLITLVGPGGIGKTRLALEAGTRLRQQFADGVCYVSLATVDSDQAMLAAVGHELGLSRLSDVPHREQLSDFLRTRRLLLILDSFENLVPAAPVISTLLEDAPGLTILCTSRVHLNLQVEQVFVVGGLTVPQPDACQEEIARADATHLFVRQARRKLPEFTLTKQNARDIASICRYVQGMPLALLLAAAWSDILTPTQIADRVATNPDFLQAELHDLPTRLRSLRSVFDSSWAVLSAEERNIFARLAIFRGGFTTDAAAAVANASIGDLRRLIDKSLIQRADQDRFEIHELLRQFAAERLTENLSAANKVGEDHASYFAHFLTTLCQDLAGNAHLAAMHAISMEQDNIRLAWSWAIHNQRIDLLHQASEGIYSFYHFRADAEAGRDACEAALQHLADPDITLDLDGKILLARTLLWRGIYARDRGEIEVAETHWIRGLSVLETIPVSAEAVQQTRAEIYLHEGIAAVRTCEYTTAYDLFAKAETLSRQIAAQQVLAQALLEQGTLYWHWNQYSDGRKVTLEAMDILSEIGNQSGLSSALMRLGLCASGLGQLDDAEAYLRRCVAMAEAGGDHIDILVARNILGWILILTGKHIEATRLSALAGTMADDMGHLYWATMCRWTLGFAKVSLGDYAEARIVLAEGLRLARSMDYRRGIGNILIVQAWLAMADNNLDEAQTMLEESIELLRDICHTDELAEAEASLATVWLLRSNVEVARPLLTHALAHITETNAYLAQVVCLPAAMLLAGMTGQDASALTLYFAARCQPIFAHSKWYADLFDARITRMTTHFTTGQSTLLRDQAERMNPTAWCAHLQTVCTVDPSTGPPP